MKKFLAVLALLLAVATPAFGQSASLASGACRLDGGAGCGLLNTSTAVSTALDLITSTRGSIFYRGASGWAGLAPGTSTYVLTSNGAGADPSWQASAASGANTALSNLASVAINTTLASGAGTTLALTATAPAAITTAQAGTPVNVTASAAVAGSSVAGAAAGGGINWTTGAAARNTSGNANGGDGVFTGGAGIGTGRRGTFSAPGAGAGSEAFGLASVASGASATAVGPGAIASGASSVAIGSTAQAAGANGISIGVSSGPSAGWTNHIAIGNTVAISNDVCLAIGYNAACSANTGAAVGAYSNASGGTYASAFGAYAQAKAINATALGVGAVANNNYSLAMNGAATTAANQWAVGADTQEITHAYFGGGVTDSTALAFTLHGTGGSGSNNAGSAFTITPGLSTGTAAGAPFAVSTGYPIASGSTAQTASTRYYVPSTRTTLTESTDTAIATLTFGASSVVGARLLVTVQADDGTDYQAITYAVTVNSVRKAAGNTVSTVGSVADAAAAVSSGTLSCTFTVTEGASAATLNANCTSSLTQTTLNATWQSISNGGGLTLAQS